MDSIFAIGLAGIQRGLQSAADNADKASKAFLPEGDGDLVTPLVGLSIDEMQVKASREVIKTAVDLQNSVLDILA